MTESNDMDEQKPTNEPLPPLDTVLPTQPAPAAPIAAAAAVGSRGRWILALGVSGSVLVVAVAAAILLGSRPTPEALTYIPGESAVVAELRMDLPGDQLQKVGNLLAHFPGFKDQSSLTTKLDETLARLVGDASKGTINYATQIEPWLAGPLFIGAMAPNDLTPGGESPAVVVATTDGTVTCDALFTSGAPTETETVAGVTVRSSQDGTFACAIDKRFGLLGHPGMVKAALEDHASHTGMDAQAAYRTARDALGGDRLATLYVAKAAESFMPAPSGTTGDVPMNALSRIPDWAMAGIRAEDDALVSDLVTAPLPAASAAPGSPLPTLPPAHASKIAPLLPADTAALVEVHGGGVALQNALAQLRNDPNLGAPLGQIDSSLALLGGADQLVGWIGDIGIVVEPDGTSIAGGIILTADGEATANAKADQIRGLLTLAGLGGGANITETTVAGTKVTSVDLGDLGSLLKATGQDITVPVDAHIVISFAAKGSALILGGGEAFVRHILETTAGATLADAAGYKHAMGKASAENIGQVYVGVPSLVSLATALIPEAGRAAFSANIQPYLAPFEAIVATTSLDNGTLRVRIVVTVK